MNLLPSNFIAVINVSEMIGIFTAREPDRLFSFFCIDGISINLTPPRVNSFRYAVVKPDVLASYLL